MEISDLKNLTLTLDQTVCSKTIAVVRYKVLFICHKWINLCAIRLLYVREIYRWKILIFQLKKEKELHFLAHNIGNVLKSGIVFIFQVGKLNFYVGKVLSIL